MMWQVYPKAYIYSLMLNLENCIPTSPTLYQTKQIIIITIQKSQSILVVNEQILLVKIKMGFLEV